MVTKQKRRLRRRGLLACPCIAYIRLVTEYLEVLVGVQNFVEFQHIQGTCSVHHMEV